MPELHDVLVEKGLVPNAHILNLNSSLTVPRSFLMTGIWNLPSRLFRFPIGYVDGKLFIKHPMLSEHPYVKHVENVLGYTIEWADVRTTMDSLWHHAVDLASEGLIDELIATIDFVDENYVAGALTYALQYQNDQASKAVTTKRARGCLKALGLTEPRRNHNALKAYNAPKVCKSESGTGRMPVNGMTETGIERVWIIIHALEDGYFSNKGTGLEWTKAGVDFYQGASFGLLL